MVVAGAGPTGLTTALLLAQYGVPSVVLERARRLTDHPQAHLLNMRTMEVFRGLDGEEHSVHCMRARAERGEAQPVSAGKRAQPVNGDREVLACYAR